MPTFKTRPAAMMQHLLKGEADILSAPATERIRRINNTPCPRCGTALQPRLPPPHALFSPTEPLPRSMGWCQTCNFEASADTGLVYSTGDGRKVDDPLPIIKMED
jgi:hypothetical protein